MIGRYLLKILVVFGLLGLTVLELGSPLVTRAILDGQAHDAADNAAHDYFQNHNADLAKSVAQQNADDDHAALADFRIDDQGTIHVTLSRQARSYVLHNFGPTKDWYNVRISASAVPK
ncbi:MAG: hypothetical protein JO265_04770 [Acidimicrobiia bacterium]|nr:hypothetical protein [Acidimicrobiia bacterium]